MAETENHTEAFRALREAARRNASRSSGINAALGFWLLFAPFVLGYAWSPVAFWNELLCGLTIVLVATVRALNPLRLEILSWIASALGGWLIVAPFLLGYSVLASAPAVWNSIIVGIIVVLLAGRSAMMTRSLAADGVSAGGR